MTDAEYLRKLAMILEYLSILYDKQFHIDASVLNDRPDTIGVQDEHGNPLGNVINMNSSPEFKAL
jgi:hypothetical protein